MDRIANNSRARIEKTRSGFTLMEALVSLSIITFASSILLLSVESTLSSTLDSQEQTIAAGIADQIIDEVISKKWIGDEESDPLTEVLSPSSSERLGSGRSLYDDTDDFADYSASPPDDVNGATLGLYDASGNLLPSDFQVRTEFIKRWKEEVKVYYVESGADQRSTATDPTALRAVEVIIYHLDGDNTWREVLTRRRVFAYIPS